MQHGDAHGANLGGAPEDHGAHEHRGFKEAFLIPLAIPVGCVIVLAAIIAAISQILLTVPETVSTPIALAIALIILLGCAFYATTPRLTRQMLLAGVAIPVIVLGAAGIASAVYKAQHGMAAVEKERGTAAAAAGGKQAPAPQITTDNKFSSTTYQVEANKPTVIQVKNDGKALHNMHILDVKDTNGQEIKTELLQPGQSANLSFTIGQAGTYNFQCDVHPTEMKGTITVVPSTAGAAAATAAGGAAAADGLSEVTTDNKFSQTSLTADHGASVSLTLQNKGAALHNWHVLNVKGADGKDIATKITPSGQSDTITFQIDQPGTYDFQCDVHPTEMKGKLTVK